MIKQKHRDLGCEDFPFNKESKKYVGSSQDALKEELNQFKVQRNQEHEDNLREVYNDTELNQGTENEILKYRAERERRKRAEEDI